jgi:hypothetical protein
LESCASCASGAAREISPDLGESFIISESPQSYK